LAADPVSNAKYCTFATLSEDSVEILQSLETAIADFIGDADASTFTTAHKVTVDTDDQIAGSKIETFNVPEAPIVIKSVKVTKY
jgi:hypothetical protein